MILKKVPTAGVIQIRTPVCNGEKLNCNKKPLMVQWWLVGRRVEFKGLKGENSASNDFVSRAQARSAQGRGLDRWEHFPLTTDVCVHFPGSQVVSLCILLSLHASLLSDIPRESELGPYAALCIDTFSSYLYGMIYAAGRSFWLERLPFNLFFPPKQRLSRNLYLKCSGPEKGSRHLSVINTMVRISVNRV